MKKGVSLLACLALLLTQFAPLSYAVQSPSLPALSNMRGLTAVSMLVDAENGVWNRWEHDVSAVQQVIAFLDDNLEELESTHPTLATQYYRQGRLALNHIHDFCSDALKGHKVTLDNQSHYKMCNSLYNIQRRLGAAVSVQYTGTHVYIPNLVTRVFDQYLSQEDGAPSSHGAASAATAAAVPVAPKPATGVALTNEDYFCATFSTGSLAAGLTPSEDVIARNLSEILSMVDAFVSAGHFEVTTDDNLWKYVANYDVDGTTAYFAANAILLQPSLRKYLTHGQWTTIARVFHKELKTHDYSTQAIAQELARLAILRNGPEDAKEYVETAIEQNIDAAKKDAERNGQIAYNHRDAIKQGLAAAYLEFVLSGQQMIANATGQEISFDNAFAANKASIVIDALVSIATEVGCPANLLEELIEFMVKQADFPAQDAISSLSHFGPMVIFSLDQFTEQNIPTSFQQATRVVADFFAQEKSRIESMNQAAQQQAEAAIEFGLQQAISPTGGQK